MKRHCFWLIAILFIWGNLIAQEPAIGGFYEVGIGTKDADSLIKYWERFGYRIGQTGELSEKETEKLYGVKSKLKSIRLVHLDSDHGLIRIMQWEKPVNEGLGLSRMNVLGNRWGGMVTKDIYNLQNHAEEAISQKLPIFMVAPQRAEIYKLEKRPIPFLENYASLREMILIRPETRQMIFHRFGYDLPNYGKIDDQSFFKTSQITHVGMVIYRNQENIDFYGNVLGLQKFKENPGYDTDYSLVSSREVFTMMPHQKFGVTDFDNPKSSKKAAEALSGRIEIIWFSEDSKLENKFDFSKPGSLGFSLYTFRVKNIEYYHAKVKASKAKDLTDIQKNEFGEKSFSFIAPDGYFWTIVS